MNPQNSEPTPQTPNIATLDEAAATIPRPRAEVGRRSWEQVVIGEERYALKEVPGRFSLARPMPSEDDLAAGAVYAHARDVFIKSGDDQVSRYLIAEQGDRELDIYNKLESAGVPQLTLVADGRTEKHTLFSVPTGSKRLSREAIHPNPSNGTHIGDQELFGRAGMLYGAAWRATKTVFLQGTPDVPSGNPFDRVGMVNYEDQDKQGSTSGRTLFLCPPYTDSTSVENLLDARKMFERSLAEQVGANTQFTEELAEAALRGFDEGVARN